MTRTYSTVNSNKYLSFNMEKRKLTIMYFMKKHAWHCISNWKQACDYHSPVNFYTTRLTHRIFLDEMDIAQFMPRYKGGDVDIQLSWISQIWTPLLALVQF